MDKDIPTSRDTTLEDRAADLGELVIEREREESRTVRDHRKVAELDAIIAVRKRLLRVMLNGDEEEFVPKPTCGLQVLDAQLMLAAQFEFSNPLLMLPG
ncbi:MAG: hypothetical protein P8X86_17030 [Desulfofustis sp.]